MKIKRWGYVQRIQSNTWSRMEGIAGQLADNRGYKVKAEDKKRYKRMILSNG